MESDRVMTTFLSATFLAAVALLAVVNGTYMLWEKVNRLDKEVKPEYKGPPVRVAGGFKKRRNMYEPRDTRPIAPDYKSSPWCSLLTHPDVADPASGRGKEFRQKFRISFVVYVYHAHVHGAKLEW